MGLVWKVNFWFAKRKLLICGNVMRPARYIVIDVESLPSDELEVHKY
jgi:hypothetical protein